MDFTGSFTKKVIPQVSQGGGFNWTKPLFVFLSVVVLLFLWQWISSPMVVTVAGTGEVAVPASSATISFSVSANDANPQLAVSNVNAKAALIREYLISKGVSEGEIAEGQVVAVPASLVSAGTGGYQATISMAAKTSNILDVSSLVSSLYSRGALVVSQPVLSVENQDRLEEEALNMALKDAKSEAAKIGNKNWKFIRKIVAVSQATSSNTSTATLRASEDAAQNGVFKIVKAVSVIYKMW